MWLNCLWNFNGFTKFFVRSINRTWPVFLLDRQWILCRSLWELECPLETVNLTVLVPEQNRQGIKSKKKMHVTRQVWVRMRQQKGTTIKYQQKPIVSCRSCLSFSVLLPHSYESTKDQHTLLGQHPLVGRGFSQLDWTANWNVHNL